MWLGAVAGDILGDLQGVGGTFAMPRPLAGHDVRGRPKKQKGCHIMS